MTWREQGGFMHWDEMDEGARDLLVRAAKELHWFHDQVAQASRKDGYLPTCDTDEGCSATSVLNEIEAFLSKESV